MIQDPEGCSTQDPNGSAIVQSLIDRLHETRTMASFTGGLGSAPPLSHHNPYSLLENIDEYDNQGPPFEGDDLYYGSSNREVPGKSNGNWD